MSAVKAGLVAYSQGAPEVIVRLDKESARALLAHMEKHDFIDTDVPPIAVIRLLDALRALNLEERPRG